MFFTDCLQDVDSGYLSQVDLNDRVSSIQDEHNFLRMLYDTVHSHSLKMLLKCHTVFKKENM